MTVTTHYGWELPVVGGSSNIWGGIINTDFTALDGYLYAAQFGTGCWVGTFGGTADALTFTTSPTLAAYADGVFIRGKSGSANTGSATIKAGALAAITIYRPDETTTLSAGDIPANSDISFLIKTTGGNKAILLSSSSGVFTNLTATGTVALGVTTIAATAFPLSVNSTDSTQYKIRLRDNGTTRGYIGADSTYAITLNSDSATPFWGINNINAAMIPLSVYDIGSITNHVGTLYANALNINGTAVSGATGSGTLVLQTGPTLIAPTLGSATATSLSFSSTTGTIGTASNTARPAGSVGELIESEVLVGAAVSLTNNTAANVTSIALTAGNWLVWGNAAYLSGASTSITTFSSAVSLTSAAFETVPSSGSVQTQRSAAFVPGAATSVYPVGMRRLSLSGTTTVYLIGFSNFTVSTMSAYGYIGAIRTD